tara:strand:- start:200 stop:943 length:744 start_codon:yes stop_codon:yes gene_type:complete
MAISVDDVYKTVLLILNKEQRGYITPAEFNKLATQVQLEIFENYFQYENKQYRIPDNESEYSDRYKNVDEKIAIFKETSPTATSPVNITTTINPTGNEFYKLGTVIYNNNTEVQKVQPNDLLYVNNSPLTAPTSKYPLYTLTNGVITTSPQLSDITFTYLRKPKDVVWAYYIDNATGGYLWDGNGVPPLPHTGPFPASGSQDFELHETEQTELVIKILMYSGVIIRDPQVVQTAAGMDQQETAQENS